MTTLSPTPTPTPVTRGWLLALLAEHGVSQCGAARLLRVNPRTMRRWCAGDSTMPWAAAELLRIRLRLTAKGHPGHESGRAALVSPPE
jgi:hypothetical protein